MLQVSDREEAQAKAGKLAQRVRPVVARQVRRERVTAWVCAADVTEGCSADNAMAKLSGESAKATGGDNAQPLPGQVPTGTAAPPAAPTPAAVPPYWGHYLELVRDSIIVNSLGESYYAREYPEHYRMMFMARYELSAQQYAEEMVADGR